MTTSREDLISYISDAHKDAYGTRPRHFDFASMSLAELEALADRMEDAVVVAIEEERAREAAAIADFEAEIAKYLSLGASDRDHAIVWLLDANGLSDETWDDAICWALGLPYTMNHEFAGALDIMAARRPEPEEV